MTSIPVKSPAKINIGLNIINKRADGYHNIETIFYPINFYDVITFAPSSKLSFSTNSPELTKEDDNLILKAARLIQEYTSEEIKMNIHLDKYIPIGAGLGGGSSNAATTLKTLNDLYNFLLWEDELLNLASKLGSDAPFFIKNKPCFASSRGEVLNEILYHISYPILLVNPGIHVSTKWAYEQVKPKKVSKSLKSLIEEGLEITEYKEFIFNDFEEAIFSKFEKLREIKEKMYSLKALFSLMTGSGSTIFGIFPDDATAEQAQNHFSNSGYFTFLHKP